MARGGWLLVFVIGLVGPVSAQTITEWRLAIYLQGGATPISTFTIPLASAQCGQPTVPVTGTQINPTQIRWEDPAAPALDCRYVDSGTGPLLALPFNPTAVYDSTLRAVNTAGQSAESPRSNPFSRPGTVPSVPGRLRIGG